MNEKQAIDRYQTASPPEYDEIYKECDNCQQEVEYITPDADLCGDCYYEQYHGAVIDALTRTIELVMKHHEHGKTEDRQNAIQMLTRAMLKLEDIPE